MNGPDDPGGLSASETRLNQLLAELKDAPWPPEPRTDAILRTVRWERALRQTALTIAGLGLLLGHRGRRR